jgi:uncharacterized protein YndB with AHSA1/START domain
MNPDTPRIEVTVAAPVDVVWNALRDREKIRHWHGWDYEGSEQEIDLIYYTEQTEDAQAHTLEVQGGDRFELRPDGDGTRITLTRAAPGSDPEWDAYYDDITQGWITFLQQLKFLIERRPDAPRRTLFFAAEQAGHIIDDLGLREVAGQPAGTPFAASLAGEDFKGEVWFTSEHQLGVTVDTWGQAGLLIVASKPDGKAMAVLSTYGLDDDRYESLNARWTAWWAEHTH